MGPLEAGLRDTSARIDTDPVVFRDGQDRCGARRDRSEIGSAEAAVADNQRHYQPQGQDDEADFEGHVERVGRRRRLAWTPLGGGGSDGVGAVGQEGDDRR